MPRTSSRSRGWSRASSGRSSRSRRRATGSGSSSARSRPDAIRVDRGRRARQPTPHRQNVSAFLDAYMERCVKPAGLQQRAVGAEPRRGAEGAPRRAAARRARGAGRHQPVQDRIGLRRRGRDRDDPPRARNAPRGDELGHGADAAAVQEVAVPPIRRPHEQEGGDDARPAAHAGGGEAAARRGASEDEHARAPVRRTAAARPHHRRAGALLPARRDAADPEQARELGDAARSAFQARRRRTRRTGAFRSTRRGGSRRSSTRRATLGPDAFVFGTETGSVPAEHPDGLGDAAAAGARHRAEARPHGCATGTGNSSSGSISAGTTCGTKAPAGCSPTASTSASSS